MATKMRRVLPSGRGEFIDKEEAQGNPHEGPGTVFASTRVVVTCISAHVSLLNNGSEFTLYHACSCCLVTQLHLTLCEPMDCSTLDFPVLCHLLEFAQTQVHCVGDGIQPFYPLSSPYPPAFNLSQHKGLSKWITSSHQVARVFPLEFPIRDFPSI